MEPQVPLTAMEILSSLMGLSLSKDNIQITMRWFFFIPVLLCTFAIYKARIHCLIRKVTNKVTAKYV